MAKELVDICVEIAAKTDKAVLVHEGDKSKAVWLPLSQIEIESNPLNSGIANITLPVWLAQDKGLI